MNGSWSRSCSTTSNVRPNVSTASHGPMGGDRSDAGQDRTVLLRPVSSPVPLPPPVPWLDADTHTRACAAARPPESSGIVKASCANPPVSGMTTTRSGAPGGADSVMLTSGDDTEPYSAKPPAFPAASWIRYCLPARSPGTSTGTRVAGSTGGPAKVLIASSAS